MIDMSDFEDNALSGRIYPLIKAIAEELNTTESTADDALSTADDALTVANNAQTSANNAQNTAQTAVDRLAGDGDFFLGGFPITTKTSEFLVNTMDSPDSAQGITYNNTTKAFNFSYLGWYLIEMYSFGDLVNTRADWFQEFALYIKQNGVAISQTSLTIPPNMTKNIRTGISTLVKVSGGDVITPAYFHVANGTVNAGAYAYIRIKKVV